MVGLKRFFYIMLTFVTLLLVLGEMFSPSDINDSDPRCEKYDGTWHVVTESGDREEIEMGEIYDCGRNEQVVFETLLEKEPADGMYLCFRSARQDMEIYVGEELRKEYSSKNIRRFGRTSAPAYVFCRLKPEDSGKLIKVVTRSDSEYNGSLRVVYYGDRMDIWHMLLRSYGPEMLVGFMLMLLGIFCAIISIILGIYNNKQFELAYLGFGVFLAALWLMTNSPIRDFFVSNVFIVSNTAFMSMLLLPMPFLIYMNYEQNKRYNKAYLIMGIIVSADFVICTSLHMGGIADFADTVYIISAVCIVAIVVIIATTIIDIKRGHIKEYGMVGVGMAVTCVDAIVQIILYFSRKDVFQGIVLGMGLLFLMVCAIVKTIQDYLDMEREKQVAISANESKSMFLANMSHEIRTPINAILGMDEIILRDSKNPEILEYARDIQGAGRNLLSLINDILDFTKIESGKMEITPVEYSVSSLISDSYNMIFMRAQEKNLELKVRNYPGIPSKLFGDEVRIRQVIMNMLTNAVKYTSEGSVALSVGCESLSDKQIMLKVSVRDTGMGIKPEDQEKIFSSFKRIDMAKNRNVEGTGLGLAITKQLVELMGGSVSLKSEYGKGSIFYVNIPQTVVSPEPMGKFELNYGASLREKEQAEKIWTDTGNVLVVDDVSINIKVIIGLLKDTGLSIDSAESGSECLAKTREKKYDIIFLDHMMPSMDGVETFHKMHEDAENINRDTPVIMLTANAIQGAKDEYMQEGFSDYLAKPVQRKQLEDVLKKYLHQAPKAGL